MPERRDTMRVSSRCAAKAKVEPASPRLERTRRPSAGPRAAQPPYHGLRISAYCGIPAHLSVRAPTASWDERPRDSGSGWRPAGSGRATGVAIRRFEADRGVQHRAVRADSCTAQPFTPRRRWLPGARPDAPLRRAPVDCCLRHNIGVGPLERVIVAGNRRGATAWVVAAPRESAYAACFICGRHIVLRR